MFAGLIGFEAFILQKNILGEIISLRLFILHNNWGNHLYFDDCNGAISL